MATTEEKRIARAYNIGYALSTHEPRLLDQLINQNKNNDFVKIMSMARDHHEFDRGIPRKDYTPQFKNGFHNAKALIENNPQFFEQLIAAKNTDKDLKKGLEAGKKEYEILKTVNKVREQPKPVPGKYKDDFRKGFNVGHKLSQDYGDTLQFVIDGQKKYGAFIQGVDAGHKQYKKEQDLELSKGNKPSRELSDEEYYKRRNKVEDLKDNTQSKLDFIEEQKDGNKPPETEPPTLLQGESEKGDADITKRESRYPDWLKNDRFTKDDATPDKSADKDIEPDRE
ncbi:hypothetical protein [Mucilaginibacter psychrotolerans]|uniref:Uncharacterized protein n=1 Tax=Mucilaginibacter psychrotolerans TaxID=1524096 RepID=A0A4Y8SAX0_9SPHI|nr:hypothetical protein [Mucilaginibacter psychrotolerans]TFF36169.1 hypothetical protein E2R66_16635 [Mucilaginibacter psychrotolerans]